MSRPICHLVLSGFFQLHGEAHETIVTRQFEAYRRDMRSIGRHSRLIVHDFTKVYVEVSDMQTMFFQDINVVVHSCNEGGETEV